MDFQLALCYVGLPDRAYDYESGQRREPWPGLVYLVYVNASMFVYSFVWAKADPDVPYLPVAHDTRFKEKLL